MALKRKNDEVKKGKKKEELKVYASLWFMWINYLSLLIWVTKVKAKLEWEKNDDL